MSEATTQAGDVLAGRYRLDDLLAEARGGSFWHAHDTVLHRPVAVHIMGHDDERADRLLAAARLVGPLNDRRILRVLDADTDDRLCYVVNEWGPGESLDILLNREGPLPPRRAAWVAAEVADSLAQAHAAGLTHGRLVPENVLIDVHGQVRLIGFGVDAALLGLPTAEVPAEVADLVGLLYCALTGKWAGVSPSQMPEAPTGHDAVLRPRQVRAGIPRPLDELCDSVLNGAGSGRAARTHHDVTSAAGISSLLRDFVGDLGATGPVAPAVVPSAGGRHAHEDAQEQDLDQTQHWAPDSRDRSTPEPDADNDAVPDPLPDQGPDAEPDPGPDTETDPAPDQKPESPGPEPAAVPRRVDLPTQAGMPVFHDDTDDVEWVRARSGPVVPPPPLEDLPHKPLFAPDPPEGQPVRRPRPGVSQPSPSSYWPWQSDTDAGRSGPGHTDTGSGSWATGSGSWTLDPWASDGWAGDDTGDRVPGRSWIRLALVLAIVALTLLAVLAAYQLRLGGLGTDPDDPGPSARPPVETAAPQPFEDLSAQDFDPQGAPPRNENPELAPLVLDGDPSTSWRTSTYKQNFGPRGLKDGVGLVVDLGATKGVRQVTVAVNGETSLAAYLTQSPPKGVADLTPAAEASGNGMITLDLEDAVSARYVTIWLTSLPALSDGQFRGDVAEVQVLG